MNNSQPCPDLRQFNLDLFENSITEYDGVKYGLCRTPKGNRLTVLAPVNSPARQEFEGYLTEASSGCLLLCPPNAHNARALRGRLEWLQPRPLGTATSAGLGDRIGLATPGHVRAVKAVGNIRPIFAQQSIREMARTNRTPQQVMDDATWGIFQEGWHGGVGADADHLKTPEDIDLCLSAGYTFFTIDPGAFVDYSVDGADPGMILELAARLPEEIQPRRSGLEGRTFELEGIRISFDGESLHRAAVKYGKVVHHVSSMYGHLTKTAGSRQYELEVSVDETDQPTTLLEHFYIASELQRLGVHWVSLAPRYVGSFEKGVDYIGDLGSFETSFAGHAAVARYFGGYKLSLHSGSDKFSIYPIANRLANGAVHLKTAGTSYLEALRTISAVDPALFLRIYQFAREHYETDRASYHVSADLARAPAPGELIEPSDALDQFDAREILHVTFGSVLTAKNSQGCPLFHESLVECLHQNSEAYARNLESHFIRHLQCFGNAKSKPEAVR